MYKYYLEIKNRVLLLILVWLSTVLICYFYKEVILFMFLKPSEVLFKDTFLYFIFTNLTEIFYAYLKFSYFIGNQVLFIYFVFNLFVFLAPGMYLNEYRSGKFFCIGALCLWCFSTVMLSRVIFPISLNFFYSFHETVENQAFSFHYEAKISEYLDLYIMIYYLWCFSCQLFIIIYIFLESFRANAKGIKKFRKIFYLIFLTLATLVSPPDVISQVVIGLITVCLFEIIIVVIIFKKFLKILIWQPVKT